MIGPTPKPILAMRRRLRASGEPYLHCVVSEDMHLVAGAELQLRRLRPDGPGESPTHVIIVIQPTKELTGKARDKAQADRLDGSAVRTVTPPESAPW